MSAVRSRVNRDAPRGRRMRHAAPFAVAGVLALTSLAAGRAVAETTPQGPGAQTEGLTVAIVDLREIPDLAPPPLPEETPAAWRTTFGSERTTRREVKSGLQTSALAPIADADVVLIQGVKAGVSLRRLFQPRFWRLIVSRKVLSSTDPVGFRTVRRDLPFTTAIAIRARQDLRITARAFTLALHDMDNRSEPDQAGAAATAVRLTDQDGRMLWFASVALPASCGAEDQPCPARDRLEAWRQEKRDGGAQTLIGGRMSTSAKADTAKFSPCASHAIESDLAWEPVTAQSDKNSSDITISCISIGRIVR